MTEQKSPMRPVESAQAGFGGEQFSESYKDNRKELDRTTKEYHQADLGRAERKTVTVVMPVRNEAGFIRESLSAVVNQDYPSDKMEVIVVDGMSTDETRSVVREMQAQHANLRLIDNPGKIVPTGLNIALAQAKERLSYGLTDIV